jgi:hypothetical protein
VFRKMICGGRLPLGGVRRLPAGGFHCPFKVICPRKLKSGVATMASKKHPGFKSVQRSIAKKEGVSEKRAGAILAASSRNASAAAKRANPRLNRVK